MTKPSPTGLRITQARELVGISPEKLGVLAGMSHGVVRMIETGARQDPASTTLGKLARVLGVSVDWFLTGRGEKPTRESVSAALDQAAPGWRGEDDSAPDSSAKPSKPHEEAS